jgi:AsmA protein
LKKNKITFFDVGFDIFNGQFFFNTTLDYQYKEQPILNLKVDAKNIDIKKSLYALNHIKKVKDEPSVSGNISLKYKLTIPLDSYLDFNSASIVGVGSFAVNNLRMKGHKVMKGMSKLTNKKQFDDGEFENIEIFTDIRDGKIFFNPFTMKVSGFTTDIEGYHSFTDGKMYYILKIIIPPFDLVKIPILITGTSDNPSVNFGSGDENVRKFIDSLNIKSRLVD